jgi:signal transduction histidine kinase
MTTAEEVELFEVRRAIEVPLLRSVFWVLTLFGGALAVREFVRGGPTLAALIAFGLGLAAHGLAAWRPSWQRPLGLACTVVMVALITQAALDLGGAVGSALSMAFIPGFMACLVFGPGWGWALTGLMLAAFAGLYATTALPSKNDFLRFTDEIAMTVFTTGLAHALWHSFAAYERAVAVRRDLLEKLGQRREAMTTAIYQRLDPLVSSVAGLLDAYSPGTGAEKTLQSKLDELVDALRNAKSLAKREALEAAVPDAPDGAIRRAAMRLWLRLAVVLMTFFLWRNVFAGTSYIPTLFALVFCFVFDIWLGRPASSRYLEATAFGIGCAATGPMIGHLVAYGPNPDAPPLVVTPATVVFTALLGQRAAPLLVLILNLALLVWVSYGSSLSLTQFRLLGDIALSFVAVMLAIRCVLWCRERFIRILLQQGEALAGALQQHRRLSGTLFHDVSNHLQALVFELETGDIARDSRTARSVGARIQRLFVRSKEFLLTAPPGNRAEVLPLRASDALASLGEVFAPRLQAKELTLKSGAGMELSVRAEPDLLIESVLGNLMSNAIKFSPRGAVIEFDAKRLGSDVALIVSDRGPGIPREVLRRLGGDGAVPSKAGTSGEQGQGYGLQLVREHARRMGGHLELRERAGGGTEAEVWLPGS